MHVVKETRHDLTRCRQNARNFKQQGYPKIFELFQPKSFQQFTAGNRPSLKRRFQAYYSILGKSVGIGTSFYLFVNYYIRRSSISILASRTLLGQLYFPQTVSYFLPHSNSKSRGSRIDLICKENKPVIVKMRRV